MYGNLKKVKETMIIYIIYCIFDILLKQNNLLNIN